MSRSRKHCQLSGGSTLKTTWSYLDNLGDRRLAEITNTGLSSGQYSNFQFATNVLDQISAVTETSDEATVYSAALSQSATYNDLNQLTDLSGQALTYDADGNLPSDGTRTYSWDAENRLVGIDYPAEPGKHTAFAYDGLGLRTTIVRTPTGGGNSVTTAYVWCGMRLCQVRDVTDAVILGSATFASTGSAPAYAYDPYGNPLQPTAPLTDFGYAGMLKDADSGLNLAVFRAYAPVAGRRSQTLRRAPSTSRQGLDPKSCATCCTLPSRQGRHRPRPHSLHPWYR